MQNSRHGKTGIPWPKGILLILSIRSDLGFHEAKDSRAIAEMVINPNNEKGKDRWDRIAVTLMIGAILHIKYAKKDQTIRGLIKFLSKPRRNVMKIVDVMLTTNHDPRGLLIGLIP